MDASEFFQAVSLCRDSMHATALSLLKNEEDAADVVQESILKAYYHLDSLRNPQSFRPWLMQILRHSALGWLRRQKDTVHLEPSMAAPEPPVDSETRVALREAVERLRPPYGQAILLFYYRGCSTEQIARLMEVQPEAVRQYLSRGRKLLARELAREDFL